MNALPFRSFKPRAAFAVLAMLSIVVCSTGCSFLIDVVLSPLDRSERDSKWLRQTDRVREFEAGFLRERDFEAQQRAYVEADEISKALSKQHSKPITQK